MSLNLQCPRLNRRALYGLISSAKALEGLSNEQSKGLKTYVQCTLWYRVLCCAVRCVHVIDMMKCSSLV